MFSNTSKYIRNIFISYKEEVKPYFVKRNIDLFFVFITSLLGISLNWEIKDIAFLAFVVWIILNPWKSQTFAKFAIFFLLIIPVSLFIQKDFYAEQSAIYAYYFLIFTIIRAIIERKTEAQSN